VFQFRYFMLRLRIRDEPAEMTPRLTGVVERLGSGERRDFSSSEELVKVMEAWDADLRPQKQPPRPVRWNGMRPPRKPETRTPDWPYQPTHPWTDETTAELPCHARCTVCERLDDRLRR
jgi:hypothetical protein